MNEVGFCPVVSGVLSSGVLSCGVLSVWGFVLWGFIRTPNYKCQIEKFHSKFCKQVLRVHKFSSNVAVRGELGRCPPKPSHY